MTEEQLFIIAKLVSSDWKWFRATDLKLKYRGGSSGLRATRETGKKVHEIVFGSVFLYFRLKWFIWNPLNLLFKTNRLLIANNQSIKGELEQNCFSGLEKLPEFFWKIPSYRQFYKLDNNPSSTTKATYKVPAMFNAPAPILSLKWSYIWLGPYLHMSSGTPGTTGTGSNVDAAQKQ